ncbi:pyridoxal-phosphate dependent enzyme [Streptomyces sp. B1866]|uniref:pyridoxal-phosphate dependent enzyme n=1 Tax=Streptomyces sp. B1866 TaxID=3075431 RepID=UPI002891F33C|nr:pyridoxal-phosphate dependent enzyme [Streptomyces sp. B1866]MDT3398950.1 pyridoxal-phosphate dependent enzyme [Streptomyces sp. B1866]
MEIHREDPSVVRRYASHLADLPGEALTAVSQREGARILRLAPQGGVPIDVLDLSTLSTTGTFKDCVACVSTARAARGGHRVAAAQSSGNTANALAAYAPRAGLRLVALHPPASRGRVLPHLAHHPAVTFVEVDAPEDEIKRLLREATAAADVPALPPLRDQIDANSLRAHYLYDAMDALGDRWHWHVQALSSAYGPFGFYHGWQAATNGSHGSSAAPPRFLGVQQEAVAPYAEALGAAPAPDSRPMLEPTLFRRTLTPDLADRMRRLCRQTHGTVRRLPNDRYLHWEPRAIRLLEQVGIPLTRDPDGTPRERAGLYSLAGTLEAVTTGLIPEGQRVLVVYTGGSGPAADTYTPHHSVTADQAPALLKRLLTA